MNKLTTLLFPVLIALCIAFSARGASHDTDSLNTAKSGKACPAWYITAGTGIGANTGLLGVSFDKPYGNYGSFDGGLGWSTWGLKLYAGAKVYFKHCQRGWALGSGFTFSTGKYYVHENLEEINGQYENVSLRFLPQANLLLAIYHYGNLRHTNRFFFQLGWSVRVTNELYKQVSGSYPLNRQSGEYFWLVQMAAPGGPVIGLGFSFGSHSRHKIK